MDQIKPLSVFCALAHDFVASSFCRLGLVSLLTWRIWRFTIRPLLHPEEPKEVPYWIPRIKRLNYTREPFAVTLGGRTLYIISDPKDAGEISRNATSISRDPLTKEIYRKIGIPSTVVEQLFTVEPNAPYNANNPRPLHPTDATMEIYRQHLSPGPELDAFLDRDVIPRIEAAFTPDRLCPSSTGTAVVSLHKLCVDALVTGIIGAYYGELVFSLEPDLIAQYLVWERVNWKFVFGLPRFVSGDMLAAQRILVGVFTKYFALCRDERGHSNFWVESVESSLRDTRLGNEDIARVFMLQTWAILGNMFKTAFWMVAYILHDPALLEAIALEVQPALSPRTQGVNHEFLTERCPKLDSLYSEVLRLTMTSPLVRDVSATTTVGGKTLQPGTKAMVLYRQLHLDHTTWGPTPETLQPERFLRDETLKSNIAYRPWGAGRNVCPGRFLAKKAVFAFVACLLARYHVGLETAGKGRFPRADLSKPTPGIASIAHGEDVLLLVRRSGSV
ncbi:putative cytochrome P450 [Aspergillus aurantiobrunneus]